MPHLNKEVSGIVHTNQVLHVLCVGTQMEAMIVYEMGLFDFRQLIETIESHFTKNS
jgi:hypothetical protein